MPNENIENFTNHFREQHKLIDKVGETAIFKTHKKLLYAAIIDALSGIIYPTKSNGERFRKIILDFGKWDNAERISMPHLIRFFQLNPDPSFTLARKFAHQTFSNWHEGDLIGLEHDLSISEIMAHWTKDKSDLNSFKHYNLIYVFRNALIHEFRTPDFHPELAKDTEPYYMSVTDMRGGKN